MIELTVVEGVHMDREGTIAEPRLCALRVPFSYKDILKSLPGARWNPGLNCWHYPPSADSLRRLMVLLPQAELGESTREIATKIELLENAQAAKDGKYTQQPITRGTDAWDHQVRAYWFAQWRLRAQGGAMLALDMGTGKTKVTIDLINNLGRCGDSLIMCPNTVLKTWEKEWKTHSPQGSILVLPKGMSVKKKVALAKNFLSEVNNCGPRVIVVNHEAVWRGEFKKLALDHHWEFGVVDESHRAKAPGGVFSKFLRTMRSRCDFRLALTGTPAPHSPLDFYAQCRFIDPSVFGDSWAVFKARYGVWRHINKGKHGYDIFLGLRNQEELAEKFQEFAIQIKARDCLELPEEQHVYRTCELDTKERKAYEQMKKHLVAIINENPIAAKNTLAKMIRLAQICNGEVMGERVGESKKQLLRGVLDDLPRERIVVFGRFHSDLDAIHEACAELEVNSMELSGREDQLEEWKQTDEPTVLAVQLQAGGVGISMVEARYCIYYSVDFNLGNYDQSMARVLRPGQERNVTYIHLLAEDTIDETIYSALSQRRDIVEAILGGLTEDEDYG